MVLSYVYWDLHIKKMRNIFIGKLAVHWSKSHLNGKYMYHIFHMERKQYIQSGAGYHVFLWVNNTQVILGHSTFTGRLFRFSYHSENYKNPLSGQSNFLQKMTEDRFVSY